MDEARPDLSEKGREAIRAVLRDPALRDRIPAAKRIQLRQWYFCEPEPKGKVIPFPIDKTRRV